jgi:hypothetical protein
MSVRKAGTLLHVRFRGTDEQIHTVTCTPGHPFWVAERAGYVSADELLPDDTLAGPEGERLTFLSAEHQALSDAIPVYNFEVAEAHTYFVTPIGGAGSAVLVHNGLVKCDGADAANGNSKSSKRPQHMYEIFETANDDVVKTGISGQPLNQNGTSPRANRQVSKFNGEEGEGKFRSRIVGKAKTREKILSLEEQNAQRLRDEGNSMRRHSRP